MKVLAIDFAGYRGPGSARGRDRSDGRKTLRR